MLMLSIELVARMISETFENVELEEYSENGYGVYVNDESGETIPEIIRMLEGFGYDIIQHDEYENSYTLEYIEYRFYITDETVEE